MPRQSTIDAMAAEHLRRSALLRTDRGVSAWQQSYGLRASYVNQMARYRKDLAWHKRAGADHRANAMRREWWDFRHRARMTYLRRLP